jgi:hypothetical protein
MGTELRETLYEQKASEHSKSAIFFWVVAGVVWIILDSQIELLSLIGFLLLFPGIFVASFVSIPLFLVRNKIALDVIEKRKENRANLIPFLHLLDFIQMVLSPILYIQIIRSFT